MICPNCAMFTNLHKNHNIINFEETVKYIKDKIKNIENNKLFDIDHTQFNSFKLQEIRLKMEKTRQGFIKDIECKFKEIIEEFNNRKLYLLNELDNLFITEMNKIKEKEELWELKSYKIKEILLILSCNDKDLLVYNSSNMLEGLEFITQELKVEEFNQFIDLSLDFELNFSNIVDKKVKIYKIDNNNINSINFSVEISLDNFIDLIDGIGKFSLGVPVEVTC